MRLTRQILPVLFVMLLLASREAWPQAPAPPELSWYTVPLFGIGFSILMQVLAEILPRYPNLYNPPDKKKWKALDPERQAVVAKKAKILPDWISVEGWILSVLIQGIVLGQAYGLSEAFAIVPILVYAIGISPVVLFLKVGRIQEEMRRQYQEQTAGVPNRF